MAPMKEPVSLPNAFDAEKEGVKFLSRIKSRASREFRWTRWHSLENASRLAYWLYVFGRTDQALEVCRFVSQYQFAHDYNFWSWVEYTLALQSRLLREEGNKQEASECIKR